MFGYEILFVLHFLSFFFFFNDTATTEIYTLSLHDALPISPTARPSWGSQAWKKAWRCVARSEEHTSELQSLAYLVCRLLLEKKNIKQEDRHHPPMSPDSSHRYLPSRHT